MKNLNRQDIMDMVDKLKDTINWAEWDYKMSDQPGFKEPEDKRTDTEIINLCSSIIDKLEELKQLL